MRCLEPVHWAGIVSSHTPAERGDMIQVRRNPSEGMNPDISTEEIPLPERLAAIRQDIRDEYLQPHQKPWIVGFSGGKDSTLVLQLVFEVLLELPPSRRTRLVHVLSNDTLVESPVIQNFVDQLLDQVRSAADGLHLPMTVVKTTPDPDNTFWVNLIGRGYPAPTRLFRWCTDRMKIRPTSNYIKGQISIGDEVILLLGVRRAESSLRARSVKRYDNDERLNAHNDLKGCLVYRPIKELSTEDVWMILLQRRPPWGGTHHNLVTLYRNAQGGECPFVVDSTDAPSCGTNSSRFGCWTCTVVDKDKSLQGFVDSGFDHLEPLVDFRDWLQGFSRDFGNRMKERRNGESGTGPFTPESRRLILERVLKAQAEVGVQLITDAEVRRIEEIWSSDEIQRALNKADKLLNILDS
jgi:DNA sulfur modification protein DndC